MRAIVVAGTCSGAGKSSIALGLMAAYTRRGLRVHPFKIGPDFSDPMHHKAATGHDSYNLDSWMMSREANQACFIRCAPATDVAIVEGVFGMFDGRDGKSEAGSTAEMAKILGAPVLLVLDTRGFARSAAALIRGYTAFDPEVTFAGIIFNKLESSAHKAWLMEAVSAIDSSVKVLGGIPIVDGLHLAENQFYPSLSGEEAVPASYIQVFADLIEHHVDLDGLLEAAGVWKPKGGTNFYLENFRSAPPYAKVRIGVARDAAFCLYYQENLSLLQDAGAEIVFFSPLKDSLPTRLDAIIFGGGYLEHHLEKLSLNKKLLYAVRAFADAGGIIYGEAGGAMYLSQGIETDKHQPFTMCGVFPFWTRMKLRATTKEYVKATTQESCVLFPPHIGEIRGYMLNCSEVFWLQADGINICPRGFVLKYETSEKMEEVEGYMQGNAMATFARLHFGSNPAIVHTLIDRCRMDSSKAAAVAAASASAVAHAGPAAAAAAGSAAARAVTAALGESREMSPSRMERTKFHGKLSSGDWSERGRDPFRRHTRSLSTSPVYTRLTIDEECPDIEVDIKETTEDGSSARIARSKSEVWDARGQDALSPQDLTEVVTSMDDQFISEEGRAAGRQCLVTTTRRMDPNQGIYVPFTVKVIPHKIVSLFPVATEILLKLGAGHRLLGVTDACDKPAGVRMGRHIVCRNQQRSSIGKENELSYKLDLPWLSKTKPHLIITQKVCSLCYMDSKDVTEEITRAGLQDTRLFVVNPHTEACQLINSLRLRLRRIAASVAVHHQPRLLLLQGLDPLTLGGRWIAEMEILSGAYDGLQKPGCASERLHWQRITSYAPEFIILAPCSTSVEQTLSEVHKLARQPGFWSVPAVECRQVYICDGSYFSQPGLRVVEGMELLAHILHPSTVSAPSASGVLKLSLKPGQKCRPEELYRHFLVE
ncbi:uncharacterized protein LOC9659294 isoform X2 [Selaginella moellendorffii]|uniref:uncharacterized protein LOC9659294 isoform X2 n=1 Tax=Selaginella moellendorffii TaxID=88036 RepID=UPI000D1C34D7|nr:uncharacterized protein LOC9659294 isoform X2 [Selaginella moellendorffii]|eukprot:XP_024539832.1 uncharacterized protein LOC9659294 isoform X2 [Selaginella moellendorffii]